MTFIEILMALAILTFGIIPLVHHLTGATRRTRISLRQVQGANHAANLMEALRSTGYQTLRNMPAVMVQLRGNENRWDTYGGQELSLGDIQNDGLGDAAVFEDFKRRFFGDQPAVPEMESLFTRYFYLHRVEAQPYITIIVRVEWPTNVFNKATGVREVKPRHVELRTVLADPFRGGSSG